LSLTTLDRTKSGREEEVQFDRREEQEKEDDVKNLGKYLQFEFD